MPNPSYQSQQTGLSPNYSRPLEDAKPQRCVVFVLPEGYYSRPLEDAKPQRLGEGGGGGGDYSRPLEDAKPQLTG